jgi:hypothetical protein
MVKRPTDLSPNEFQAMCLEGCTRILGPEWSPGGVFHEVAGRTPYWTAKGTVDGSRVEVFIYDDQAEFAVNGSWTVCEWQDFDGLRELATTFLAKLEATARRLRA